MQACSAALPAVYFMAQEAREASVGCGSSTSPTTTGSMWEGEAGHQMQMHAPSLSSFPSWCPYAGTVLPADTAFGEDPSSSADTRLPSSDHLHYGDVWNQSVLSAGAHGSTEHGRSNGYRENFLSLLASKNVTPEMFDDVPAACDYLKGMDGGGSSMAGPAAYSLDSSDRYADSSVSPIMHEFVSSPLVYQGSNLVQGSMGCVPCYEHEEKERNQQQEFGAPMAAYLQQMIPTSVAIHNINQDCSGIGTERICPNGRAMESSFGMRNLPDAGSFSGYRSTAELMSMNRLQEQDIIPARTSSSSGSGAASDPKKRKSEERMGGNVKKSKQEASDTSPPKPQATKVKLGEKITALQQIVSPFGKTDTASVLFETIKYIKFLHEQIQLSSEPYMTTSTNKGDVPWGGEEKKAKAAGLEHDLRRRGLCLVPVSWTPQVYRDNSVPDCWTPAYRSCLYR